MKQPFLEEAGVTWIKDPIQDIFGVIFPVECTGTYCYTIQCKDFCTGGFCIKMTGSPG